jgi:hypothetical protein
MSKRFPKCSECDKYNTTYLCPFKCIQENKRRDKEIAAREVKLLIKRKDVYNGKGSCWSRDSE